MDFSPRIVNENGMRINMMNEILNELNGTHLEPIQANDEKLKELESAYQAIERAKNDENKLKNDERLATEYFVKEKGIHIYINLYINYKTFKLIHIKLL